MENEDETVNVTEIEAPDVNVDVTVINPDNEPDNDTETGEATPVVVVVEDAPPATPAPSAGEIAHEVYLTETMQAILTKLTEIETRVSALASPVEQAPEPIEIVAEPVVIEPDEPPAGRGLARHFRNEWK